MGWFLCNRFETVDANEFTSDNKTVHSNQMWAAQHFYKNVSGTTHMFNSLNVQDINILNPINNLNSIVNSDLSTVNIYTPITIIFLMLMILNLQNKLSCLRL